MTTEGSRDIPGSTLVPPPIPAGASRRAVIDVGTNSVKVLVADVQRRLVEPVWEQSEQTRLGKGFYESRQLQPEAIAHTARAVATFAHGAREFQASPIRVIATSAARDARNQAELLSALESSAGLPVEVITGTQEAEWAYRGVTSDPALADRPLLILDIGGGSTEFIVGNETGVHFRESFPLGSVRLLEQCPPQDPPTPEEFADVRGAIRELIRRDIAPALEPALRQAGSSAIRLVGTGGATTILARMEAGMTGFDRHGIEDVRLERDRVEEWLRKLWSMPLATRKQITGLPPNRADVILFGVAIYAGIMVEFGFAELSVSTRGLRFGALMDAPGKQA